MKYFKMSKISKKEECTICAENLTPSIKIKCEYCDFVACKTCCRTYICDRLTPTCMSSDCNKKWTDAFMIKNLNKNFMNTTYKKVRENTLYEQEKALLPATQEIANTRKELFSMSSLLKTKEYQLLIAKLELKNKTQLKSPEVVRIHSLKKEIDSTENKLFKLKSKTQKKDKDLNKIESLETELNQTKTQVEELETTFKKESKVLSENYFSIHTEINKLKTKIHKLSQQILNNDMKTKKQFIKKCSKESCRGYLSTLYKCGICYSQYCSDCHEIKDDNHVCNPDTLSTVRALKKETRNCPNISCGIPIYKIDGCDQMWCTSCHTAFSWKTGEVENKVIHNPHYFQYMRDNNIPIPRREDAMCQEDTQITHNQIVDITDLMQYYCKNYSKFIGCIYDIFRHLNDIKFYVLPKFEVIHWKKNFELRCDYLENAISEEYFKTIIQQRDKKNKVRKEIHNILDTVCKALSDILLRVYNDFMVKFRKHELEEFEDFNSEPIEVNVDIFTESNNLRDYANTCLENISKVYSTKCKRLNEHWTLS